MAFRAHSPSRRAPRRDERGLHHILYEVMQVGVEPTRELFKDTLAVTLAASCAVETAIEVRLDADREDDPPHLHPHRKPERVEVGHRPRQDLVTAIERHAEQVLDLLCRRPMAPAGRKVGHARHAWERDNAAVLSAYAELACSLQWRACHRPKNVAGVWRWGKHSPRACARVITLEERLATRRRIRISQ